MTAFLRPNKIQFPHNVFLLWRFGSSGSWLCAIVY